MPTRKVKTIQSCNYYEYYKSQSGGSISNDILVYRGKPYQRGSGFFSNFRYAIPFLKRLGKETLDVGRNIILDVASGKDLKTATKRSLKRKASELLKQASDKVEQYGTGRKRIKKLSKCKPKKLSQIGGRKKIIKRKKTKRKTIKKLVKHKKKLVYKKRSYKKHRAKGDIFM